MDPCSLHPFETGGAFILSGLWEVSSRFLNAPRPNGDLKRLKSVRCSTIPPGWSA